MTSHHGFIDKNIATVKKITEEDNKVTLGHQFKIGSLTVITVIYAVKQVISRFVPHHLSDYKKKTERVRI